MYKRKRDWMHIRRKLANIMKVGATDEAFSREYDIISTLAVVMITFDSMELQYGRLLIALEAVTVAFFAIDYILRVWTAYFNFPGLTEAQAIKELDISRQTIIVMVKRNGTMLVPNGNLVLMEGDHVILYSQERINHANLIHV